MRHVLPEVAEPLDELRRVVLVKLDVWEEELENSRAGVAYVEEHQLGLAQVHRGQGAGVRQGVKETPHAYSNLMNYRTFNNKNRQALKHVGLPIGP